MDSNFFFLKDEFPILFNIGVSAENYLHRDPIYCLTKLRLFGEKLAQLLFEEHALEFPRDNSFHNQLVMLTEEDILPTVVKDILFLLKKKGNTAVHDNKGSLKEAKEVLESVFWIGKWYYNTYSEENKDITKLIYIEPVYTDDKQALQKREEEYKALEIKFNELLAERKTNGISVEQQKAIQLRSEREARKIEMSEAQTRVLIDEMLRKAGWEVDSVSINYKLHKSLPEKGKYRAIAEWPTGALWADYALFIGTQLYGLVEAKKYAQDISTDLHQAKIYAEHVKATNGITLLGKWDSYKVPFLFSTNGRPYLEQLKTKSGIWFWDAREKTNIARPLQGWFSPEGLIKLWNKDVKEANQKLAATPLQFLEYKSGLGLRKYQIKAIEAVEHQIINHPDARRALVAMATGTGKTRTVIGLCYHLIQTNRFHRILFLVDRTLLGVQALNAFKDNKVVDLNTFAEVYGIKELKDMVPDAETRLHFATVQGMVKRLFYNDGEQPPPIDQYDCIIIDEAHRGYLLDREIDEEGLDFKNQQDYVSKYTQVLNYFDAYAIGLTATPALHTTEIFGKPIYTYSYREAVIDGFLIDHDPPFLINTRLAEEGIVWNKGEKPKVYDKETNTVVELDGLEDELQIEVAGFNKRVLTESFNRTVVKQLVQQLDPDGDEKTLIFAATDEHAGDLVQYLKEEFQLIGVNVADDSIQKITGKSYNPLEQLTRFKNEKYPTIAITVDLLTTGIDVPAICNLVFMRRVKSRILYEQMLGRATRRCDDIGKETFRIYDAVRLYEALEDYTQMKPVVVNPKATFEQLAEEFKMIDSEERAKMQLEQIIAKIQRKKRALKHDDRQMFTYYSGSESPEAFIQSLQAQPIGESIQRMSKLSTLWRFLDELKLEGAPIYVSEHEDSLLSMGIGYGIASKPEDYLESFAQYLRENQNKITALNIVCTRPTELNRESLKELLIVLSREGYQPRTLGMAWKQARNEDIGADIISMIRTLAVGSTLESHDERIKKAVNKVRTMRNWNKVQQKWLDRFEKQLLAETVLQPEDLNESPFDEAGGFQQLDKVFENQLGEVIQTINQHLYPQTA